MYVYISKIKVFVFVFVFVDPYIILIYICRRQEGHPVVKTLLQYTSLTPLEREWYEGEVQPYRKTDYKPMMMIYIYIYNSDLSSEIINMHCI